MAYHISVPGYGDGTKGFKTLVEARRYAIKYIGVKKGMYVPVWTRRSGVIGQVHYEKYITMPGGRYVWINEKDRSRGFQLLYKNGKIKGEI